MRLHPNYVEIENNGSFDLFGRTFQSNGTIKNDFARVLYENEFSDWVIVASMDYRSSCIAYEKKPAIPNDSVKSITLEIALLGIVYPLVIEYKYFHEDDVIEIKTIYATKEIPGKETICQHLSTDFIPTEILNRLTRAILACEKAQEIRRNSPIPTA